MTELRVSTRAAEISATAEISTAAEISASNNPLKTLADEVREHFTSTTRIVAFMNSAQRADLLAKLPNFVDVAVPGIAVTRSTISARSAESRPTRRPTTFRS